MTDSPGGGFVMQTNIGSEEQWREIDERHPGVIEALNELICLSGRVAGTSVRLESLAHEIVFALSRVCIEECWEILLLASNHYGTGALKILRGLYERAVTVTYISKNPEKAQRFRNFAAIQEHRTLAHARKLFPDQVLDEALKPMSVVQLEENYKRLKPEFQKTKCKACKSTETANTWDIDLPSMAERAGEGLPGLLLTAYAVPTLEFHATLASALSRTSENGGHVVFDYRSSVTDIDLCIAQAFALMHIVLKTTVFMFSLPLEEELVRFGQVNRKAWA